MEQCVNEPAPIYIIHAAQSSNIGPKREKLRLKPKGQWNYLGMLENIKEHVPQIPQINAEIYYD